MKRKIKDYAIIAAVVVGFFLPFVLVALGFAFSWTIAIVAGTVCEIGIFFFVICLMVSIAKLIQDVDDANKKIEKLLSELKEELK